MKQFQYFKDRLAQEKHCVDYDDFYCRAKSIIDVEKLLCEAAERYALYNRLSDFQQLVYMKLTTEYGVSTRFVADFMGESTKNMHNTLKGMENKAVIERLISEGKLYWKIKKHTHETENSTTATT